MMPRVKTVSPWYHNCKSETKKVLTVEKVYSSQVCIHYIFNTE